MPTPADVPEAVRLRRRPIWLLPVLLLVVAAVVWTSGASDWLTLEMLSRRRSELEGLVRAHPFVAPLAFVGLYAAAVALSLPGAAVLTISSGMLFGVWLGALWSVIGATIGAVAIFLIARTSIGVWLRQRAGSGFERVAAAFRRDGFSYLLVLRLIPLFPFWLVNLVPALLGMRLLPYTLATAIGMLPGSLVFAGLGEGLVAVLQAGDATVPDILLQPRVLLPLLGLALLSMLPVAYRWLRMRSARTPRP